jgi:hypothetical protein
MLQDISSLLKILPGGGNYAEVFFSERLYDLLVCLINQLQMLIAELVHPTLEKESDLAMRKSGAHITLLQRITPSWELICSRDIAKSEASFRKSTTDGKRNSYDLRYENY